MKLIRKINQAFGNFTTHEGVIVLTYHRVNDRLPQGGLVVHPREFKKQMRFLYFYRKQFQVIGVRDVLKYLNDSAENRAKDKRSRTKILITFDDGYRDNYIHAFPVLKKYRFPAVVFLTTSYIGSYYKKECYQDSPWRRDYLDIDEINKMMQAGIDFGAHTAHHPHLKEISSELAEQEISKSYDTVREITNRKDIAFCYPYGEFNESIKDLGIKSGFSCAFTIKPGINYRGQDLFEIKRIDVLGEDNFSSFKYKITDKYVTGSA